MNYYSTIHCQCWSISKIKQLLYKLLFISFMTRISMILMTFFYFLLQQIWLTWNLSVWIWTVLFGIRIPLWAGWSILPGWLTHDSVFAQHLNSWRPRICYICTGLYTVLNIRSPKTNEPDHEKMCLMSYVNNKGADQPAHPHSLISAFVVRCLDSIISLDSIAKISRL